VVRVRGGAGAGCFPLDTGGVGSEPEACVWVGTGDGKLPGSALAFWAGELGAGVPDRLVWRSFEIAAATVDSVRSNSFSTLAVSSSAGELVPLEPLELVSSLSSSSDWVSLEKSTLRLLRYVQ